jgi:hypothetical protein
MARYNKGERITLRKIIIESALDRMNYTEYKSLDLPVYNWRGIRIYEDRVIEFRRKSLF